MAADLLMYLAMRARRKTPAGEEPPWAARSFVPYHSQLISAAVQCEAAEEILDRVGYETDILTGSMFACKHKLEPRAHSALNSSSVQEVT